MINCLQAQHLVLANAHPHTEEALPGGPCYRPDWLLGLRAALPPTPTPHIGERWNVRGGVLAHVCTWGPARRCKWQSRENATRPEYPPKPRLGVQTQLGFGLGVAKQQLMHVHAHTQHAQGHVDARRGDRRGSGAVWQYTVFASSQRFNMEQRGGARPTGLVACKTTAVKTRLAVGCHTNQVKGC
jgi:hypothetical protein